MILSKCGHEFLKLIRNNLIPLNCQSEFTSQSNHAMVAINFTLVCQKIPAG
jgi:hypothetical protein